MEVGGISGAMGGAGMMSAPGVSMAGLAGGVGAVNPAANAASQLSPAAGPDATVTVRMQQLAEMIKDFSSAEILLMLMMMRGDDDRKCGGAGGAAMGLLAGLALAGQINHMTSDLLQGMPAVGGPPGGGAGTNSQINFMA